MKLQIKTLNQKSLVVDIDMSKTVYELKKELSLYADVGVQPELQKLIYAGKILLNDDMLSIYNIDAKKFLVVMILKQPEEEAASTSGSKASSTAADPAAPSVLPTATKEPSTISPPNLSEAVKDSGPISGLQTVKATEESATRIASTTSNPSSGDSHNEELVQNIVSMGYPEAEVRRALAASFNNPERAIEYLIEGIPESVLMQPGEVGDYGSDADVGMTAYDMFRGDPLFRNLRRAIQQHPELINEAIQRVGEANPAILELINENQQEFLRSIVEGSDDDDDEEDDAAGNI